MPNLHVANTSKQIWIFTYRASELQNHMGSRIPPGKQICLEDLTSDQIDKIIKQNAIYGMIPARELSRRKGYAGIVYNTDGPIKMDNLLASYDINDEAKNAEAQERRQKEAVAITDGVATHLSRLTGVDKNKMVPQRLEMEIVEDTEGTRTVSSGVEVIADPARNRPRHAGRSG